MECVFFWSEEHAMEHYEAALAIRPGYGKAHANLAASLLQLGDRAAARRHLELARRNGFDPPPDLVILDLVMPGRSGLELLSELRERESPPTQFVVPSLR